MPCELAQLLVGFDIPNPNRIIGTARSDSLPANSDDVARCPAVVTTQTPPALRLGPLPNTQVEGDVADRWERVQVRCLGTTTDQPFYINFAFQRGVAASGTFNLGPTIGNQTVTSTMVFDLHNNLRALVATPKLSVGFTGAITGNGNVLYGRFSFNNGTGWTTGMFTLTRG